MASDAEREQSVGADGLYCSTSGTTFHEREALADHYKSDLHRYNLKRKVAGLPPVTAEWFEARKEQLQSLQSRATAEAESLFICPLTNKRFQSEGTYESHTRTKKFKEALKKAGLSEAPPPKVAAKPKRETGTQEASPAPDADVSARMSHLKMHQEEPADSGSDWQTDDSAEEHEDQVSQEAEEASSGSGQAWQDWDVRRSLFDNHMSPSFEKNIEYMYKRFGFVLPDAPCLTDPQGLLQYLGAKLQIGRVPLYTRGDDAATKRFRSLHAVQRHMVDSNRCAVCYDENEDEYADFYEYEGLDAEAGQLAGLVDMTAAQELLISQPGSSQMQILGSRNFKQLYKQRHRPAPSQAVATHRLALTYRGYGAPEVTKEEIAKRTQRRQFDRRRDWGNMKSQIANDKIYNLPKNVTY